MSAGNLYAGPQETQMGGVGDPISAGNLYAGPHI